LAIYQNGTIHTLPRDQITGLLLQLIFLFSVLTITFIAALRDTFQAFDTGTSSNSIKPAIHQWGGGTIDGDGTISPQEITSFLHTFGENLTHTQLDGIMKEFDANRNGLIDFDEFVSLMSARSKATGTPLDEESDLREAFRVFDLDGNGTINAEELRSTMKNIGVYLTDEELDLMMKEADEDGNGVIDFQGSSFFFALCLLTMDFEG